MPNPPDIPVCADCHQQHLTARGRQACAAHVHRCRACRLVIGRAQLRETPPTCKCGSTDIAWPAPCSKPVTGGSTVCHWHGKKAPQTVAAAQRRAEQTAAARAVATFGLPVDVTPEHAILQELARTNGHVLWLADVVADLEPQHLTWGKTQEEEGFDGQGEVSKTTSTAAVNVWVELYERERTHLLAVAKAALAAGIAERQIRLAEQQGQLVADLLRAVIGDPELGLTPAQIVTARKVASRHLLAIEAATTDGTETAS